MTGETESLVLEPLPRLRADMAAMNERFDGMGSRLDAIETQLKVLRCVFVACIGSLAGDVKDHETRIVALEGVRA